MTYSSGGSIQATDYNTFAYNTNRVWGVGTQNTGYGQTPNVANVAASSTITAAQWETIRTRVNTCTQHQTGSTSNLTVFSTSATVTYDQKVTQNVQKIYDYRLNFNGTRGTPTTAASWMGNLWNTASPTVFNQVRTATFSGGSPAAGDGARYFFNAGGRISIKLSVSSGTNNNKEQSWTDLTANIASMDFSGNSTTIGNVGGVGSARYDIVALTNGYHGMTTSNVTLLKATTTTSPYNVNYLEVIAKSNGTTGANQDSGTILTFYINYYDSESDLWGEDAVNMTMWANIIITPPETTYLTNSWGTITTAGV